MGCACCRAISGQFQQGDFMRSESLAYFLEIAESGSFTHAAKKLYVSQQGLSKSIKALERDLGCRLFRRTGTRLELTSAGRTLIPYARRCIEDVDELRAAMEPFGRMAAPGRRADSSEEITLHATAFVSDSLLSLLQAELRQAGIDEVQVIEHSYAEIIHELKEGRSSNLFALCIPEDEVTQLASIPHVIFRPMFVTEIILVGSSQFIHPDKGAFSLKRVAKLPIVYYNDPLLNRIIHDMFRDQPLEDARMHSSSLARIDQSIRRGKAVTFSDSLSAFLSEPDEGIAAAAIEGAGRFVMGFAYLDNAEVPPGELTYMEDFAACFNARCAAYLERYPVAG